MTKGKKKRASTGKVTLFSKAVDEMIHPLHFIRINVTL